MKALNPLFAGAVLLGLAATSAAATEQFMIDTANDLAQLCATAPSDPNYSAAIHMCQGFMIGAHHFHEAIEMGSGGQGEGFYCVPETGAPTRDQFVADFATWVSETPDIQQVEAIEALVRYAAFRFPCN